MRKKLLAAAVGLTLCVGTTAYMTSAQADEAASAATSSTQKANLTIRMLDAKGARTWSPRLQIVNLDDLNRYSWDNQLDPGKDLTLSVPTGHYLVAAMDGDYRKDAAGKQISAAVVNPNVVVSGATTVTLDVRTTRPVRQRIGTVYTTAVAQYVGAQITDAKGKKKEIPLCLPTGSEGIAAINLTKPAAVGSMTTLFSQRSKSLQGNRFYTTFATTSGVPRTVFTLNARAIAQAARVNVTLKPYTAKRLPGQLNYSLTRSRHLPGWTNTVDASGQLDYAASISSSVTPTSRWTEYLYPAGNKWYAQASVSNAVNHLITPVHGQRYAPGSVHDEVWLADGGSSMRELP